MKQNKIPRNEYIIQPKGKTNPYKNDVIYSDLGQWKYPGQVTRIPSNQITMQGVPYPVQGVDDTGYSQMMYPGMDYQFPGQYVTEYPQMQIGGLIKKGLTAAKKVAKNTYKVNPWAEKLKNPNSSYRVAGLDAYDDFKNTGILRSATPNVPEGASLQMRAMYRPTSFPSFQKGYADLRYLPDEGGVIFKTDLPTFKRGDINPVTGFPIKGRHYAHRVIDSKTGAAINDIPASNIEVYSSEPHWLKGFMGIPKEAYGGDPSLPNIEGHYPFGGMYSKTHTHMQDGGGLDQYQVGGIQDNTKVVINNGLPIKSIKAIKAEKLKEDTQKNYIKSGTYYKDLRKELDSIQAEIPKIGLNPIKMYQLQQRTGEIFKILGKEKPELVKNEIETGQKAGKAIIASSKYIFPTVTPLTNIVEGGLSIYDFYKNPNIHNTASLTTEVAPYINNKYAKAYQLMGDYLTGQEIGLIPEDKKQDGGWLDELDEEYRRGGSLYTPPKLKKKSKKYGTSKNIQSSINYLFTRNYDLFGPSGKTRYNPNSKYQVGGNKIDMSKVKMDYFPKSQADAQSMLDYEKFYYNQLDRELENEKQKYVAAAVKKGVPKKLAEAQVHEMLNYQEGKNQGSFQEYEPQGKLSKTIEVLANPMLAMKNYRGGRLPDYFSTNEEEDFLSPTNVSNMGYQFLTSLGNFGWGLQSADAVDRDLKNNDYQSAAIDAAFSLPALKQAKKWQKELNTIDKAKNSNAIRNAQTNTESSTIDDAVKAIKNKIAQQKVDTYNALQKLKADRPKPSMGQNKFLSGERKYSKEERDFISKNPPTSSGYYNKPSDPYYLFDFKVNPARPLEEIVAPYKKKHGGWLDYLD